MEQLAAAVISAISPAALPIVVCVLGCVFIYLRMTSQRKATNDEIDKRLTLVEHDVKFMKEEHSLFAGKLDRILNEICEIKIQIARKVNTK